MPHLTLVCILNFIIIDASSPKISIRGVSEMGSLPFTNAVPREKSEKRIV